MKMGLVRGLVIAASYNRHCEDSAYFYIVFYFGYDVLVQHFLKMSIKLIKIILGFLTTFVLYTAVNAADTTPFPERNAASPYQLGSNLGNLTQPQQLNNIEPSAVTGQPVFLRDAGRSVSDIRQGNRYEETAAQAWFRHWCGCLILPCYYCSKKFGDDSSGD
jgi:hypothetical protein